MGGLFDPPDCDPFAVRLMPHIIAPVGTDTTIPQQSASTMR